MNRIEHKMGRILKTTKSLFLGDIMLLKDSRLKIENYVEDTEVALVSLLDVKINNQHRYEAISFKILNESTYIEETKDETMDNI